MQTFVTTSVTEAECVAATSYIQEMQFGMQWLEALGLKVESPVILHMDNKGAVDLLNSWPASAATRHMSARLAWMRELKEQGILEVQWEAGTENAADVFAKNLDRETFEKHASAFMDMGAAGSAGSNDESCGNSGGALEGGIAQDSTETGNRDWNNWVAVSRTKMLVQQCAHPS